jgi:hypothetical protein
MVNWPHRADAPLCHDAALERLSPHVDGCTRTICRPSIPPEKLLRALLLQMLYSVRSEDLMMESSTTA